MWLFWLVNCLWSYDHIWYLSHLSHLSLDLSFFPAREILTDWWFQSPWKNMSSSVGMMTFPTEWKKNMFQTSNHIYIYIYVYIYTHMYICSMVKIHTNQNLFLLWSSHHHSGFLWDFLGISMASTGQVWTGPLGPLGISDSTGWNGRRLGQVQGLPSRWDRWDRIAPTWGSPSKMASWKVPYIYITGYSWNKDIFIYPEGSYIYILSHYYHYIYIHSGYLT